jgi:hypothetical protein
MKKETHTLQFNIKVSPVLKKGIERCARKAGLGYAEWTRAVLARAVHEGAFTPQAKKGGS